MMETVSTGFAFCLKSPALTLGGYGGLSRQLDRHIVKLQMVYRFWRCYASGAFCTHGECFLSEDEVLWWSKGGKLKGESSRRIAFLREIIESLPGPLTPAGNVVFQTAVLPEAEREAGITQLPKEMHRFLRTIAASIARMEVDDRTAHLAGEHEWASHAGEDAYLWFNDRQCFGEQTLFLPEAWHYRIELIDVWAMTRTVLLDDASGETLIRLPGREGLAVLATRISK